MFVFNKVQKYFSWDFAWISQISLISRADVVYLHRFVKTFLNLINSSLWRCVAISSGKFSPDIFETSLVADGRAKYNIKTFEKSSKVEKLNHEETRLSGEWNLIAIYFSLLFLALTVFLPYQENINGEKEKSDLENEGDSRSGISPQMVHDEFVGTIAMDFESINQSRSNGIRSSIFLQ